MIRFACPGCNATYTVEDGKGGKAGKCPKCQAQFVIPAADVAPGLPPVPPPEPRRSPPPPPPADDGGAVEIKPCPKCGARLSVAAADLGVDVECPYCQAVYTAKRAGAADPPADRPSRRLREEPAEDRPSRRRRDDDEDDRPARRSRRDDAEEDDRPSRRRRDEDDEPAEDDRPRRRRRRSYEPHRGGLILGLGVASFLLCGIFTGLPAMIMGGSDLKKMDAGRMDPDGRGLTQAGRILGIINVVLTVVAVLFYCVIFVVAIAGGAAAAGAKGGR